MIILQKDLFFHLLQVKLLKIIFLFAISIIIYQIVMLSNGEDVHIRKLIISLLNGGTHVLFPFSWYILTLICSYIFFIIIFKYMKKDLKIGIIFFILVSVSFLLLLKILKLRFNYYISFSLLCFCSGIVWKLNEKTILNFYSEKKYNFLSIIIISSLIMLGGIHTFSIILIPITVFSFLYMVKISNIKLLEYIGIISYDLFLLHGIVMILLRGITINITNDHLFIITTIFTTFISAYLFHRIKSKLESLIWNRK